MEKQEKAPFTWGKLKEFCNTLTEDQLQQTVYVPQEESSIEIKYASDLGEDHYYFPDHEYRCTKDDFDPDCLDTEIPYKSFEEAYEHEEVVFIPSNSVYLFDDF